MKNACLLFSAISVFLVFPFSAIAQRETADPVREGNFAFEVKVMDEFFERFNDNPNTLLRTYLKRMGESEKYGRKELIVSLFNHPERWAGNVTAKKFLLQVLDAAHPQGLRFNDSNWYAEAISVFEQDGRLLEIPLILQIQTSGDNGSKWVISGIGDSYIFRDQSAKTLETKDVIHAESKSLSPSDYATNFLSLRKVLVPTMNPSDCISASLINTDRGKQFINLIRSGAMTFSYIGMTRFHIFQIPRYVLLVEHFSRQSINSGWLISDIQALSADEVAKRKEKLLQRSL